MRINPANLPLAMNPPARRIEANPVLMAAAAPLAPLRDPAEDVNQRLVELSTLYANNGRIVQLSLAMFSRYG